MNKDTLFRIWPDVHVSTCATIYPSRTVKGRKNKMGLFLTDQFLFVLDFNFNWNSFQNNLRKNMEHKNNFLTFQIPTKKVLNI